MSQPHSGVRQNIHMLGEFLGETIREAQGSEILEHSSAFKKIS